MRFAHLLLMTLMTLLAAWSAASASAAEPNEIFSQLDKNGDMRLQADEVASEHQRLFQRLLRTSDADDDGQLSSEEFQQGLEPKAPAKIIVQKDSTELPGTDALLLLLARMDGNSDGTIRKAEVPQELKGVFERIEQRLGGEGDGVLDRRELTRAGPRLAQLASRFAERMGIDVELELALLPEKQWQSVQAMTKSPRRGQLLENADQAREIFRRLDTDGDGQVSADEVPEQFAERFEQLLQRADRNRDDKLTERELLAVSRRMEAMAADRLSPVEVQAGVKRLLTQFDRDNNGQLSQQELPRRMAGRFARLDRDGDGNLGREELGPVVELLSRLRRPEASSPDGGSPQMQDSQ